MVVKFTYHRIGRILGPPTSWRALYCIRLFTFPGTLPHPIPMLDSYLTDSIVWVQSTGNDEFGDPLTPTSTTIKARVNWVTKLVTDFAGEQVLAAGHVDMKSKPSHADNLTISGVDHIIIRIEELKSYSRVWGYRVYFQ